MIITYKLVVRFCYGFDKKGLTITFINKLQIKQPIIFSINFTNLFTEVKRQI